MNRVITLFVAIALVAAVGVWIGAKASGGTAARSLQYENQAAVALSVPSSAFDEEGTIVMDQAPNTYLVPFILYTTQKTGGAESIRTKRLVFPDTYACQAGDLPCAGPIGNESPVEPGAHVRVVGTERFDTVEVETLYILP